MGRKASQISHFPPELRERISEIYPEMTYEEALEDQAILCQVHEMSKSSRPSTTEGEGSSSQDPFSRFISEARSGRDDSDEDIKEAIARSLEDFTISETAPGSEASASLEGTRGLDEADIDTDRMTYEELEVLTQSMGSESRGLLEHEISSLGSFKYNEGRKGRLSAKKDKSGKTVENKAAECCICFTEFKNGQSLTIVPCLHRYHTDCIGRWLKQSKICPICREEVKLTG